MEASDAEIESLARSSEIGHRWLVKADIQKVLVLKDGKVVNFLTSKKA